MTSSSDSSDSSDDEMRKRLMETVVTAKSIQKEVAKKVETKASLIKVGPYGDIELSKQQIELLVKICQDFTERVIEFR